MKNNTKIAKTRYCTYTVTQKLHETEQNGVIFSKIEKQRESLKISADLYGEVGW